MEKTTRSISVKKKEHRKCVNCGENHSAAYGACAQAKKAKQVQQIRYTKVLTYAEATQSWQQQNKKESNPQPIQQKNKANKILSKETEKQTNKQTTSAECWYTYYLRTSSCSFIPDQSKHHPTILKPGYSSGTTE